MHTVAIDPLPPAYSLYSFENDDKTWTTPYMTKATLSRYRVQL